jgi:hypothetical protein|tara:strand:- start:263 stop:475 length:213 start_codon:yes stop_codon:yes gene_type:complete
MFQKIANVAAILSLVMVSGTIGSAYFGYKYITSPQGQAKIKNAIMGDLKKAMPDQIQQQLPKTTGLGLPM